MEKNDLDDFACRLTSCINMAKILPRKLVENFASFRGRRALVPLLAIPAVFRDFVILT